MRLITTKSDTINNVDFIVKVYRDSDWDEYVCRLFANGEEMVESSYHTDDKADALDTANRMLGFYRVRADLIAIGAI
jgi:hypothetical protein